jgi:acyl-CoA thioesterase
MNPSNATRIIDAMMADDRFSQWLGIERIEEREGYCKLKMLLRPEMCNGFNIIHGGITFAFADSALAFACNSTGKHAVSIESSISHIRSVKAGDTLFATAEQVSLGNRIGVFTIKIETESGETVALFKGTVFRKEEKWVLD